MRDNQNKDLEAVKKWQEIAAQSNIRKVTTAQPEWTTVKGVKVLRIGNSKFVAAPNGNKFDIIDIAAETFICQVKNGRDWLIRAS